MIAPGSLPVGSGGDAIEQGNDVPVDLDALALAVTLALPPLDELQRRVGVACYQLISEGRRASCGPIAERAEISASSAAAVLATLPTAALDKGEVVAFLGLQIAPTTHQIHFPHASAGGWCAWDALFIPGLLRSAAKVQSRCPVSGEPIFVEVDPFEGVIACSPDSARLSFLARPAPYAGDIVASFCRWVHFLRDPQAAGAWIDDAAESLVALTPEEGIEIGRQTNAALFGVSRTTA